MASRMRHLMRQEGTLEARTGNSKSGGTPAYAAAESIKARVRVEETLVINESGERIVCHTKLYTEAAVKKGDRLTFGAISGVAVQVAERRDRLGNLDHLEVFLS